MKENILYSFVLILDELCHILYLLPQHLPPETSFMSILVGVIAY